MQVVAPDRPRSACGHSITLHKPLRADPVKLSDGSIGYSSNGTPSDCVSLGLHGVVDGPIDLVVSGINLGPNLGWDLTYSGTVSAAMEGAMAGLPSIAISVVTDKHRPNVDCSTAAVVTRNLALMLAEHELPVHTLLNVNVPALPRKTRSREWPSLSRASDNMTGGWKDESTPADAAITGSAGTVRRIRLMRART